MAWAVLGVFCVGVSGLSDRPVGFTNDFVLHITAEPQRVQQIADQIGMINQGMASKHLVFTPTLAELDIAYAGG